MPLSVHQLRKTTAVVVKDDALSSISDEFFTRSRDFFSNIFRLPPPISTDLGLFISVFPHYFWVFLHPLLLLPNTFMQYYLSPEKKTLRAECDDKNMILLPRNEAEFRRAMRQNKMWKVLKEKKRKWNFHENRKILNIRHDTTAQQ